MHFKVSPSFPKIKTADLNLKDLFVYMPF